MAVSKVPIATKLILSFGLAFMIVFFSVFAYSIVVSERTMEGQVRRDATHQAMALTNTIDKVLAATSKVPANLALFLERTVITRGFLEGTLHDVVAQNPEIYGSTVAFEPFAFRPDLRFFAPYFFRSGNEIRSTDLGGERYDYFLMDWYQVPREMRRPLWSEPYFDEGGGGIIMSTYSAPFFQAREGHRRLMGIVTADISLDWLEKVVASVRVYRTGFAFLISRNGTLITHRQPGLVMNETIFSMAEQDGSQRLRQIGQRMVRGESGFEILPATTLTGKESYFVFMPVPPAGWSLGVVYPKDEILADVNRLRTVTILAGALGLVAMLVWVFFVSRSLTRPLRALAASALTIASGNLEDKLPEVNTRDEVEDLARAFARMRDSLRQYIANLVEVTAGRQRIESELQMARRIQMDMLPHVFPTLPDRERYSLFGAMKPAREVGGDLYDFFVLGDGRLLVTIGDVSDKGFSAALFMSMTVTLVRTASQSHASPAEILNLVNRELCRRNAACMFTTLFLGILDVVSGELAYADAGHNPPVVLSRSGAASLILPPIKCCPVGIDEQTRYQTWRLALARGDKLILYTDGITEAFDPRGQMYSMERLLALVGAGAGLDAEAMTHAIFRDVESFVQDAPQSDDMTLLVLDYHGPGERRSSGRQITVPSDLSSLPVVQREVDSFLGEQRCPEDVRHAASLSLEEVLVNIVTYGYEDPSGHCVVIRFSIIGGGEAGAAATGRMFEVEVEDDARAFNPLATAAPQLDARLEDRQVGGLGIHLVRNLMDSLSYERRGDKNVLTMRKRLPEQSGS